MVEWIIEPLGDAADLDGVLDVDELSFTRPWTRAMYESEFLNRDTSRMFVLRTPDRPVAGYCAACFVLDEIQDGTDDGGRQLLAGAPEAPLVTPRVSGRARPRIGKIAYSTVRRGSSPNR